MSTAIAKHPQQGAALIAVMLLVLIVLALLAGIFFRHGIAVERSSRILHGEQAVLLALSGEAWALGKLLDDASKGSVDSLDEEWALQLPPLPVAGGTLEGNLQDLQARININRFTDYGSEKFRQLQAAEGNSDLTLLRQLALVLNTPLSEEQLAALVDWQDADDLPLPGGAEQNEYLLQTPASRPANGALAGMDELAQVAGFSPALVALFKPWLVALPVDARTINVNTADLTVLQALHPDLDRGAAEALVAVRQQQPWRTTAEFYESAAAALRLADGASAQVLLEGDNFVPVGVSSNYFLLTLRVQLGTANLVMESVIQRQSGSAIGVLARTLRFVPETAAAPTDNN
jgi:general secretion pathway protein K